MIDRLRKEIQERLDQVLAEADKLRGALAALDPRSSRPAARPAQTTRPARPRTSSAKQPATGRAAPGGTRARILAALAGGQAMTAGEVAAATGLGRGSVSTTLSKLTKSGDVLKAERGYRLADKSA